VVFEGIDQPEVELGSNCAGKVELGDANPNLILVVF